MKTPLSLAPLALIAGCLMMSAAQAADADLTKPMPRVPHKTPLPLGPVEGEQVVEFTNWKSAVLPSDVIGKIERGMFCSGDLQLTYTKTLDEWFSGNLRRQFTEDAVRLGIGVAETAKSVFDDKAGKKAGFQLGATLLAWDYRVCFDNKEMKGETYAKIKWELYSARRQKVVYSTIVEASHATESKTTGRKFDADFMATMLDNLFADPRLAEVIRSGGALDTTPAKALAPLRIAPGATIAGGVASAAKQLQNAVATVESGVGSGTAFYISRDGYLLTNEHVVAGAAFVKVRLGDGRNLVGEVLRSDKVRDVALLRTDPVGFEVFALRAEEARTGEEVYALGSPFGKVLSGTLTRGVLSARRVIEGVAFLQSDVAINPGNSGGPLIDAQGRVVGIAQFGSREAQGLGMFVPIQEAVDQLALTLGDGTGVAQSGR
jgi:S1-C subfamily serine protease